MEGVDRGGARALQNAKLSVKRSNGIGGASVRPSAQKAGSEHGGPHQHEYQEDHNRQETPRPTFRPWDSTYESRSTGGWSGFDWWMVRNRLGRAAPWMPNFYTTARPHANVECAQLVICFSTANCRVLGWYDYRRSGPTIIAGCELGDPTHAMPMQADRTAPRPSWLLSQGAGDNASIDVGG